MDLNLIQLNSITKQECVVQINYSVNKYIFKLKRYTHYYTLNMGMTVSLVIVSFIIMMVKPDNQAVQGQLYLYLLLFLL